eukprot:Gb_30995 [translate_table: standard]
MHQASTSGNATTLKSSKLSPQLQHKFNEVMRHLNQGLQQNRRLRGCVASIKAFNRCDQMPQSRYPITSTGMALRSRCQHLDQIQEPQLKYPATSVGMALQLWCKHLNRGGSTLIEWSRASYHHCSNSNWALMAMQWRQQETKTKTNKNKDNFDSRNIELTHRKDFTR